MKSRLIAIILGAGLGLSALVIPRQTAAHAQSRITHSVVSVQSGHVALGLAVRKLNVSGTFMQAPAHPDDETNALFAMFTHGMGLRSVDVQNNRGEGGQNEIGPELFRDLGVLRTSELLAAHRIDGAEQYFTRAIDYGYSFDPEEVIKKWGRQDIVGDYVRLIRMLRPDVVLTMNIQGRGGDRAHEATTVLVREAYLAAGNPAMFPDQIREGLRPWQPRKLYFAAGFGFGPGGGRGGRGARPSTVRERQGRPEQGRAATSSGRASDASAAAPASPPGVKLTRVNTVVYDELLGRTYAEIGADAHSSHKCQGTTGLPALAGFGPSTGSGRAGGGGGGGLAYQLVDSTIPGQTQEDETGLFDNLDTSLAGIVRFAGANPPAALHEGLAAVVEQAERAKKAFDSGDDAGAVAPIEGGLAAVRNLRTALRTIALTDAARYEIDFRLTLKERDYEDAVIAAHQLSFDAVADDGLVVAAQPVRVSLLAVNRGSADVSVTNVSMSGFDGATACVPGTAAKDAVYTCSADARVSQSAKPTTPYFDDVYWKKPSNQAINIFEPGVPFGVPFAPTPFRAVFHLRAGMVDVTKDVPIQFRYVKDIFTGDKRTELNVVPAFSLKVTTPLAVIPAGGSETAREVHVAITNDTKGRAETTVALEPPAGWKVDPSAKVGAYTLRAVATSPSTADERFTSGYREIEYPHIERRQIIKPAEATVKVIEVKTAPNISVGYIAGAGDQVPAAIEQLGAKLTFIDAGELAWGDLSKYSAIVTGVRAYERRADLRAYNRRLLEYANRGGTVIVQYNKFEFNEQQFGPYPALVSGNRVSDETVPVTVLVPNHPVFTTPNRIGPQAWANWVQERGLYFLGEKDPQYVDLVSMTDSFPDNPGEKLGALVEARVGMGRWIYVGLGLWRQLPAGTDGAYQLLANLIALR